MIKEMKALSMVEAKAIIEENNGKDLSQYFNKFIKLKGKEAIELKKELESLNNHKIKGEHISKIIDILPEDALDINKIFSDVNLDENEIKQITEIVSKYK
jgi:DNA-directed RNA polymerase subunit F